jgi:hypothetical protein
MKLNKEGFITNYLIAGTKTEPFVHKQTDDNQLRYEQYLRTIIAEHHTDYPVTEEPKIHDVSELGMKWEYYFSYGNWFVDKSHFYANLTKVQLVAAVNIIVPKDMCIPANLWSYAALDVWLNKENVAVIKEPVYKPIKKEKIILNLHKGENQIYIKLQNLGVRDTRNIFGIQLLKNQEEIEIALPGGEELKPYVRAEEWLKGIQLKGHELTFPFAAPEGSRIGYDSKSPDVTLGDNRITWQDISGLTGLTLEKNKPYILLSCTVAGKSLSRRLEVLEDITPVYLGKTTAADNLRENYLHISDIVKLDRGNNIGFSMHHILARLTVGRLREDDLNNIYETLDQIDSRMDCSDFMLCAIIRYIKNYPAEDGLKARVKEVLLNFRYWMDEEGSDGMCFWSENHSLMFYTCAMNAGEIYPEEVFTRSGLTGKQLYEKSRKRVYEWLCDVENNGFEEFLSGVYMSITFAALLNVIDYSDEEIVKKATKVTDTLLYMVALHTFQGVVIAPQGRVYRDVIYPFRMGIQTLVNLMNPETPYTYGEGWLSFYATSSYKIPKHLAELMKEEAESVYHTGNAQIVLEKKRNYCMTSVQSPREDTSFQRWENISFLTDCDVQSHEYVKSINERFHGTTCFEPGVYGYQQHLWNAALHPDTIVFVNHPGGPCDESSLRPGYWFGNGVMPAVKQEGAAIASIYVIPEEHPIDFTHIHWPESCFDQWYEKDNWLVGKRNEGYVGIWSSEEKVPYNDQLFHAEYRIYSRSTAYLCICSDTTKCSSLEEFLTYCRNYGPVYKKEEQRLYTDKGIDLTYKKSNDRTQYI